MEARHRQLLVIGLGVACLLAGAYLAVSTYDATSGDTAVEATIVESRMEEKARYSGEYSLHIEYAYTYDGTEYTSTDLFPSPGSKVFDESEARQKVRSYREGTVATAYVDPDAPAESYLIAGDTGGSYLGAGVLIVLGLGTVVLAGASLLSRSLHQDPEAVSPIRAELRSQFLAAFETLEAYPIEDYSDVRYDALDPRRTFESNDFECTVRDLQYIMDPPPQTPCGDAEELTDYVLGRMDEQGYFR